jgi:hypothetical protein
VLLAAAHSIITLLLVVVVLRSMTSPVFAERYAEYALAALPGAYYFPNYVCSRSKGITDR